jgi:hypothetical protein
MASKKADVEVEGGSVGRFDAISADTTGSYWFAKYINARERKFRYCGVPTGLNTVRG